MRKPDKTGPASADEQRLTILRERLLALHKTLVEAERERYQKTVGPITSANHFLQLLTNDPWFAWLHPLSQLIVTMDEATDGKEPLTGPIVDALVSQAQRLLVASEDSHEFGGHYFVALQNDPDVVLAHSEVVKLVGRPKASG